MSAWFFVMLFLGVGLAVILMEALNKRDIDRAWSHGFVHTRGLPPGYVPPSASLDQPAHRGVEPRDETDPFCTCPSCGGLGTHAVEVTVWEERWVPGTRLARRTCVFCGHVWHTAALRD